MKLDINFNLFLFLVGSPLINYGSSQSTNYGETTRFKPYVDPAAYEDPNQVDYLYYG